MPDNVSPTCGGLPFFVVALLTLGGAVAAVSLRNLVHCALCLTATFAGLAVLYLQMGADFVGFAQILVYVGAVAILIVFSILLTRGLERAGDSVVCASWLRSIGVAVLVAGVLITAAWNSAAIHGRSPHAQSPAVRAIGEQLMTTYVIPLQVAGLLLTAALLGAALIAMKEKEDQS
jgi:NADH-quinone oxidoreductase subunit J